MFSSDASNLVPGDTNGASDCFLVTNLVAVALTPAAFTLAENSPASTVVGTVTARHAPLTYAITTGNADPDGDTRLSFAIDPATGAIRVNDAGDLRL